MQRRPAEDSDAYNHSAELNKSGGKTKNTERRRRRSAQHEGSPQFSVCINLGDVPPEKINATITDRTVNISGEQDELIEEEDGMVRRNYQGFSNTFNIPPEVNIATLNLTVCEKHTLLVEADYFDGIYTLEDFVPKQCQTCPRQSHLKSLEKLSTPETSSLDVKSARTPNSWSDLSQETLYESTSSTPIVSHQSSRRTSKSNADTTRQAPHTDRSSKVSHAAERRGSKTHQEESRRFAIDAERYLKSTHSEGRRNLMSNKGVSEKNLKARVPILSSDMSTDYSDTSLLSSELTSNSTFSDQATSTDSFPTTELSQPSFEDMNVRTSPISTMESLSCPCKAPPPRSVTRSAPALSTLKRRKHAQRTVRKGKKFTFDSFPFCCCPRF